MMKMANSVALKMRVIDIAPGTHDQYLNASRGHMVTAVAIEDGAFGMYASHRADEPTKNYTFEVYNSQAAYKSHVASTQHRQFQEEMADVIVNQEEVDLVPQFMGHQAVALNISTPNDLRVNIVQITVKSDCQADFHQAVVDQLQTAIDHDSGILAIYAGTKADQLQEWVIYEIFQSEETYCEHVADPVYQEYLAQTKNWIDQKRVDQTVGDILINKGDN